MRVPSLRARLFAGALSATLLAAAAPALGQALPTGGSVVAGAATIGSASGGTLTVNQTSQRAVVDWRSFSIGQGGVVDFRQGANAAILNRVTGADASTISGLLRAQGAVYLVNPNGLFITKDGVVDARGGFVGSTLGISNADFMAGRGRFAGGPAGAVVSNAGRIQVGAGGFVGLLGGSVANDGVIVATQGRVDLIGGQAATLDLNGGGFLQVMAPAEDDAEAEAAAPHEPGLRVLRAATARDALRETVNMPAAARARAVSRRDGVIRLESIPDGAASMSGTIEAAGGTIHIDGGRSLVVSGRLNADQGRIDLTADDLRLTGASLSALGGLVRLGGAFQGGRAVDLTSGDGLAYVGRFGPMSALRTADTVAVDGESHIDVDGGAAVVWSAKATSMSGWISAGTGAVEVSSKESLAHVNLGRIGLAASGKLLLDPKDLIVGDGDFADPPDPAQNYSFGSGPQTAVIWSTDLAALLSTGADVTLQASNNLSVLRSVLVSNPNGNGGNLTLTAGRTVDVEATIQTDSGNLTIVANAPASMGVVDAERDDGQGGVDLKFGLIDTNAGNISVSVLGGAGNTFNAAGSLDMGEVHGNSLTLVNSSPDEAIRFFQGAAVGGAMSLTGNIRIFGQIVLEAPSVTWTNEGSATVSAGEGGYIKFVENGVMTRYGLPGSQDSVRLALGPATAGSLTRVYGDADPTPTGEVVHVTGGALNDGDSLDTLLVDGSVAYTGPGAHAAAGSSSITLSATDTLDFNVRGYFLDTRAAALPLTITPKTITASLTGASYTYGSPTAIATLNGLLAGDSVNLAATVSGVGAASLTALGGGYALDARTRAGPHSVALTGLSGADAGNYSLDLSGLSSVNLTISPKTLTYSGSNLSSTYGSAPPTLAATLAGILAGDTVSATSLEIASTIGGAAVGLAPRTHAGSYLIRASGLSGADAGNYVLDLSGLSNPRLVISPKAITYIVGGPTTIYGNPVSQNLNGILGGDDVQGVVSLATGTLVPVDGAHPDGFQQTGSYQTWFQRIDVGQYKATVLSLAGANAGDYTIAATGNSDRLVRIDPRPLQLIPQAASYVYGSTGTSVQVGAAGLVPGDVIQPVVAVVDAATSGSVTLSATLNAGTYTALINGVTGADAGNYSLQAGGSATITVTPKPVTYAIAGGGSAVYGAGGLAPGGVTLTGVLAGDAAAISGTVGVVDGNGVTTTLGATTDAGGYTARVTALISSNPAILASNYTIATSGNVDGAFTITPRPLTYSIASGTIVYGNLAQVGGGYSLTGFAGTEFARPVWAVTNPNGDAVTLGDSGNVTPDLVAAGSHVGAYQISIASLIGQNGFKASNYTLTGTNGVLTITPKALTYSIGSQTGAYGSTTLPGATLNGRFGDDDVVASGLVLLTGGGSAPLSARTAVGTYNVGVTGLAGADADNYTLATTGNADGTLTIVPKVLSWTVADVSAVYGDPVALGGATLDGVVAGDTVSATVGAFTPNASPQILNPGYSCTGAGCAHAVDPTADGPLNVGAYVMMVTGLSGADAANYRLKISLETGSQFQTETVGHLTYTPRPVTLQVFDTDAPYLRMERAGLGYQLVAGSFVTGLDQPRATPAAGQPLMVFSVPVGRDVGTYDLTATVSGGQSSNYAFTILPGHFTITPLAIRATTGNTSMVYGDSDLAQALGIAMSQTTFTADDGGTVGAVDYTLNPQGVLRNGRYDAGGYNLAAVLTSPNYRITSQTMGALTVRPRPLTIGDQISTVFGDDLSHMTPGGVLPGDDFTIQLSSIRNLATGKTYDPSLLWDASGKPRDVSGRLPGTGEYAINGYTVNNRAGANYDIQFFSTLKINPRPITITGFGSTTATYGTAPVNAAGYFTGQVTYSNLVNGGDAFQLSPLMAAWAANTPVGDHSLAAVSLATLVNGLPADCFSNACASNNYVLASSGNAALAVRVLPKPISWQVANASTVYGTAVQQTVTITGLLAQDIAGLSASLGIFDGSQARFTNTATSDGSGTFSATLVLAPAGNYDVELTALTGAAAGNYSIFGSDSRSGQLTVTPKTITYTTASAVTYYGIGPIAGSVDHLGEYTLNGVVGNDQLALTLEARRPFIDSMNLAQLVDAMATLRPGTYDIVGTQLFGPSARNYVLAATGNTIGTLTSLNFSALNQFALLDKPATQITNAIAAANAAAAGAAAASPLPPTGQGGGVVVADNTNTGPPNPNTVTGSTSGGMASTTLTVGSIAGNCSEAADCGGVLNVLDAWAGAGGSLADFQAGARAEDEITGRVNFGCNTSGGCHFDGYASVDTGAYVIGRNILTDNQMVMENSLMAGYGVEAGGAFGTSGTMGSAEVGGGVTAGKFGAGGKFETGMKDGILSVGVKFEVDVGIGISIDLSFGFNVQEWGEFFNCLSGCDTSYQVPVDPDFALHRAELAQQYAAAVTDLRQAERNLVTSVLSGAFNDNPQEFNRQIAGLKAEESGVVARARRDSIDLKLSPGQISLTDNAKPEMRTVQVHTEGLWDSLF